jgi:ankyrin repeat protein/beta-lactamase regulating signal transducer with metallopeptidase domain
LVNSHQGTGGGGHETLSASGSLDRREEPAAVSRSGGFDWRRYAPHVLLGYLLGSSLLLARLVVGLHGGQRLRRLSEPVEDAAILTALARQARALGLRFTPAVACCGRIAVPAVVGVLRPMILLPLLLATSFTPEQIEVLLAHELAHIRRYDHLWNVLQRIIEALLFFHPAVWIVSRRIRAEREHCCDDDVLAAGGKRLVYAESLVRVAELSLAGGAGRPAVAVAALGAQGRPSELRGRIMRLIGGARHERVHLRRTWVLVIPLLGVAALTINCLRPSHPTGQPATWATTQPAEASASEAVPATQPVEASFADAVAERVDRMLRDNPVAFLTEQDGRALVASFREFVAAHPPKPMSSPRRETLLAAVENEVRWWGQTDPEHIYLQFDQKVDSLKMNLWLAMNRGELDAGQLARMQEQRQWMRDFIGDLPEDPRFARDPVLAELENAFQNPFCVFFDRPMNDDEWARFTRSVEADPETKRFPHIPIRLAQAAGNVQYSRESLSDFPSPFDDRVYAGVPWIDGFQFSFRSHGSGLHSNVIGDIDGRKHAILSIDSNHLQSVPDDIQGSDALKKWISTLQQGDLYYDDADGGALVAVRGARLALLRLDGWLASDQLADDALRELVTRHGRSIIHLKEMTELERAMRSISMRLAALTSAGQLAVLNARFIGPVFDRLEVTVRPRPLPKMKYATVGAVPSLKLAAKTEAVPPHPPAAAAASTPEGDLSSKAPEERLGALMRAITEGKPSRVRAILDRFPELLNPAQSKYTPLFEAAMRNNLELAQMLIDRGAEVDVADSQGYTALDRCGNYGYAQMAELLIKAGANVNAVNAQRKEGTPLHTAASEGHNNVIDVLIRHGADLNAKAFGGFTPLTVAVLTGHADSAKLLAERGAELDLLGAAGVGRLDVVRRMVTADPPKTESAVAAGMTALHAAAMGGHLDVIQFLLSKGADPNARGMQAITPLDGAARNGHTAAVELLLNNGADVNGPSHQGRRPLHTAVFPTPDMELIRILLANGADVNAADEDGYTPLHAASQRGSAELIRMLLDRGADVNARSKVGRTPLHSAAVEANLPVIEALLSAGARIHVADRQGTTPLHFAVFHGFGGDSSSAITADLLLTYGADANARDENGQTPLHLAAEGKPAATEVLMNAGADPTIRDHNGRTPLEVAHRGCDDVIRTYTQDATHRERTRVSNVADRFLGALSVLGTDGFEWCERAIRNLVIESPPRMTYEQWLKSAAEIRKVYANDKERLTAIREAVVEGNRAAVRVDGPEGSGRYLFLILGKTRGGWRVTDMDDSSEGIPLRTHLLNAAPQPAEDG